MNKKKTFDCVQFQRDARERMLKEADYDLGKLVVIIQERLKDNDLHNYFKERKEKEKVLTAG